MNIIFKDPDLEIIYREGKVSQGRYKIFCRDKKLVQGYIRVVDTMYDVENTDKLKIFSFLHYEKLKHKNISSVRIVNGYVHRLLFTETKDGLEIELLEINDTHYGTKR